jgi:hypothetical protein
MENASKLVGVFVIILLLILITQYAFVVVEHIPTWNFVVLRLVNMDVS